MAEVGDFKALLRDLVFVLITIHLGCEKVREGSGFDLSCPDPLG
jgi:hypothetical protein